MKDQRLFVLARRRTRDGQADAYRNRAAENFEDAARYAGYQAADILQGWDDPNEFWHAETWMTDTLHQDTFDSPSHLNFMADTNPMLERFGSHHFRFVDQYPCGVANVPMNDDAARAWADRNATHPIATPGSQTADRDRSSPFCKITRRQARPDRVEPVLAALRSVMQEMQSASGVVHLDLLASVPDPSVMWAYETWASEELHNAFIDGPAFRTFEAGVQDDLVDVQEPVRLRLIGRYVRPDGGASGRGPRIPLVQPNPAAPGGKALRDAAPADLTIFQVLAHAERSFKPIVELVEALLSDENALAPQLRQLAILEVSRSTGSNYEWAQHLALARKAGVPEEKITSLAQAGGDAPLLDATERLILRAVAEADRAGEVTEATVREMLDRFGPAALVELLLTVGHYRSMACVMRSAGLPPEAPAAS